MASKKKKQDNQNIGKELKNLKLRPVELNPREKRANQNEEEPERREEKEAEEQFEHQRVSQFSERILSEGSSGRFRAPILEPEEQRPENLEETAARSPVSTSSSSESQPAYTPSSLSYSGSGKYEKKDEGKYRRAEETRPILPMNEHGRRIFTSEREFNEPDRGTGRTIKSPEKSDIEEFSREQQYKIQKLREEKPKRRW